MSVAGHLAARFFSLTHSLQRIPFKNEIIEGKMWLGNLAQARKQSWLTEKGITHVCCITQWGEGAKFFPSNFEYFAIDIEDKPGCDLLQHLEQAVSFIEEAIEEGGKVYVHCNQGRSRSGTVVVAYFIRKYHLSVEAALKRVQEKRPVVCPNEGFLLQLRQWQHLCEFKSLTSHVVHAMAPELTKR
eukprot:jgi/Bigna1/144388/aug1.87_g19096